MVQNYYNIFNNLKLLNFNILISLFFRVKLFEYIFSTIRSHINFKILEIIFWMPQNIKKKKWEQWSFMTDLQCSRNFN